MDTTTPPPLPTLVRFYGRCSHCGHETESAVAGLRACKWGRCNGTVNATASRTVTDWDARPAA